MWRAISTATASAATQRGAWGEAITRRARPPISADRTTLASVTTAAGSEIVEDLLLGCALGLELRADLFGEAQEHFAANLDGQLWRVPWQVEAGRGAVAGNEDHVVGVEHLAGAVAEVANGHDLHVVTFVVTQWMVAAERSGGKRSRQATDGFRWRRRPRSYGWRAE